MNTITDIFFDLDHTLWDFDKNSVLAFDKIFKTYHPKIDTNQFVEIYAPINQACWKLYQVDKITHEELRYQRLKQTFDILNYTISDEEIDGAFKELVNGEGFYRFIFGDETYNAMLELLTKDKSV